MSKIEMNDMDENPLSYNRMPIYDPLRDGDWKFLIRENNGGKFICMEDQWLNVEDDVHLQILADSLKEYHQRVRILESYIQDMEKKSE